MFMQLSPTVEKSGWIQTYSGVKFEILDPTIAMIKRADIAHGLSMICRFNGHTRWFYSVAQHSVIVSELVEAKLLTTKTLQGEPIHKGTYFYKGVLAALLHDATEAYIGDITRPLKKLPIMAAYHSLEQEIDLLIREKFDLSFWDYYYIDPGITRIIKEVDNRALCAEARDLLTVRPEWLDNYEDSGSIPTIIPLAPKEAEKLFLGRLHALENNICNYLNKTTTQQPSDWAERCSSAVERE